MKIYLNENVWDAALKRFRWLFDEFENIIVNVSGGKDSTVCLNLALMVAEEKGRLPLKVSFIDQEAEWQTVIDHMRQIMADPRVEPHWLQVPIRIFNATSTIEPWLNCWEPGKEWIRDKEPISIKENVFGTDRFAEMFGAQCKHLFGDSPACMIGGVRAEESPARLNGLTAYETYKGETWGRVENKKRGQYVMYPIYDWSYTDVWKAIHDNHWLYCPIYDYMYQYGYPVASMRVSNVHHETAVMHLKYLQEIEGATWNKIVARISGLNSVAHLQADFMAPKVLPPMFSDWFDYRDHLLKYMVTDDDIRGKLRRQFASADARYSPEIHGALVKVEIACVLLGDYHGTKLSTFAASHGKFSKNNGIRNRGLLPPRRQEAQA